MRLARINIALCALLFLGLFGSTNVDAAPAIPRRVEAPQRLHFAAVGWYTESQGFGPGPDCESGSAVADTPWEACEKAIPLLNKAVKCNPCGFVVCGPGPPTPPYPTSVSELVELNYGSGLLARQFPPYTLADYTVGGVELGTSNPVRGMLQTNTGVPTDVLARPICPAGTKWEQGWYGPANNGSCLALHCPIGSTLAAGGQCEFPPRCPEDGTVLSADGTTCSLPGPPDGPNANENADGSATCKPVVLTTGAKKLVEVDLPPVGRGRLQWTRTYDSLIYRGFDVMSSRWTHTYTRRMWWKVLSTYDHIGGFVFRPDGTMRTSIVTGTVPYVNGRQRWSLSSGRGERLYRLSSNLEWIYIDPAAQSVETFTQELRNVENYWGRLVKLQFSDGVEQTMQYSSGGLVGAGAAPVLDDDGNPTDQPLPPLLLIGVRDSFGRSLSLGYDARRRLVRLVDPAGSVTRYTYDARDNLTSVIRPDGTVRRYLNNETANTGGTDLPHAVTGIIDEREERLSTYQYDSWGRALSSTWWADDAQTKPAQRSSLTFDSTLRRTTVTDALESERTFSYALVQGRALVTTTSQPAGSGCGPASSELSYDSNGNVLSRVDFNGNKTCHAYDTNRNLETKRVEGLPTAADCPTALATPPAGARVVSTQWHPDWNLRTAVAEPKRITITTYNGYGASCAPPMTVDGKPVAVPCSRTEQATTDLAGVLGFGATATGNPRRWVYTYATYGRVLTATDPNGKRTVWTYYRDDDPDLGKRGSVETITNAAGHVTRFPQYNLHTLPTRVVDPNGLVSTFEYDSRMRLRVQTVGAEVTRFEHDPAHGQVTRAVLPDGSSLSFTYDTAYRLISVADHRGNRVDYSLDAAGNRIQERMKDSRGTLVRNITRVVDALNRIERVTGASR